MTLQIENSAATATHSIGLQRQQYSFTLSVAGGMILLGLAFYALVVLHQMEAKLEDLPRMTMLLTTTNDRLAGVSSQMEQVSANMKKLPPLLNSVNANVSKIAPPLRLVNKNVQGTAPTLMKMDGRLALTNQRLTTVQQKLDTLRQSIDRMEETTHRLRKVLPR